MTSSADPSPVAAALSDIRFVLCDLDGVVWLGGEAIPGAPEAVARLRSAGCRVLFVTNNSMSPVGRVEERLAAISVPAEGDVVTSAQAAASLVGPGERVRVAGGPGVIEAVGARGATPVTFDDDPDGDADAVIVGLHQDVDYWRLQAANRTIRAGARFIATNDDATYPTPDGPLPGAGTILAAVATASATDPVIAGKPHRPMAELVAERCGPAFAPRRALMVGDRYSTDGRFAAEIRCPFALVRSGVGADEDPVTGPVELIADDLAAVADAVLAG